MRIPLDQIDVNALPRDRTVVFAQDDEALRKSILVSGLRQPIEVMQTRDADEHPYALISGYRRLAAFKELYAASELDQFAEIPAVLRAPKDVAAALREMVEENAIRTDITPWDEARIAVDTVPGVFETVDAAVAGLYASVSRQRRHRIRAAAEVVECLGHFILEPELWSRRRLDMVASACRGGYTNLICDALGQIDKPSPARQWQEVFIPILREAAEDATFVEEDSGTRREPRRFVRFRSALAVRRVRNIDGWSLKFTGPDAKGELMEHIMDDVERRYGQFDG